MSIPNHYLEARTKAGRLEIKKREGIRHEQIGELKTLQEVITRLKTAKDLDPTDVKIIAAEMSVSLSHVIKDLSEAQLPYDTFGESYSEGQKNIKKRVAMPDRC